MTAPSARMEPAATPAASLRDGTARLAAAPGRRGPP